MNNRDYGKTKGPPATGNRSYSKMADGGSVEDADKAAGLASSSEDRVGFLERLKAGNIDDANSEAYRRWGAGKGVIDRAYSDPSRQLDKEPSADPEPAQADKAAIAAAEAPRSTSKPGEDPAGQRPDYYNGSTSAAEKPAEKPATNKVAAKVKAYTDREGRHSLSTVLPTIDTTTKPFKSLAPATERSPRLGALTTRPGQKS